MCDDKALEVMGSCRDVIDFKTDIFDQFNNLIEIENFEPP